MYDLIILGGGPAGYRAAELAGGNNIKTLLVEKNTLGGVCLNEGCIPSKTMLHSAKLYDYANGHGEAYGVYAENARLDHAFVINRKDKIVKTLVSGISASMKSNKVEVIYGEGKILGKDENGIRVSVNGSEHTGSKLLICTGSEALLPPIDGLKKAYEDNIALTNREILSLKQLPKSLCVIGGGVIGLEMASYFNSAGSAVTVIEMLDKIAGPTDAEISSMLLSIYKSKGVSFHVGARVTSLDGGKVSFEKNGESSVVSAEKVLVSVGRRAVIKGFGLETLGVLTERGMIVTDEQMKTNVPGVFAAGDVNGKSMLAHTAYREAEVAVNTIRGKKDYMDYSAIPSVIYTNPEAASVGETEESAKTKGLDYTVKKLPMNYSGRFMAENERGRGICKLLFLRESGKLIGVSMLANPSSEIIAAAAAMLEKEVRALDMQKIVFPHPTVGEIIRECAF